MKQSTSKIPTMPSDPKARRERKRGRIATRNGRPAYENPPPPMRAPVPMSKWCERHGEREQRPSLLARALMAMKARDARAGGR